MARDTSEIRVPLRRPLREWQCDNCGAILRYEEGGITPQCSRCHTRGAMKHRKKYY